MSDCSKALPNNGVGEGASVTTSQPLAAAGFRDFVSVTGLGFVTDRESLQPLSGKGCDAVTDRDGISSIKWFFHTLTRAMRLQTFAGLPSVAIPLARIVPGAIPKGLIKVATD